MSNHAAESIPLVARASLHPERTALIDAEGAHTYLHLLDASARVAAALLDGKEDLAEARVAYMVPPGFAHVAVQWGIWRAGGVAVPLAVMYPPAELAYVLDDTGAEIVVTHPEFAATLAPLASQRNLRFLSTGDALTAAEGPLPRVDPERRATMLYTSGTTSKPKGVVATHQNIAAQITMLVDAWGWTADDQILHVLPLHHVHGIIAVLSCALWSGAACRMLPRFDADEVWRLLRDERELTLFMAVPTIYSRLIAAYDEVPPDEQTARGAGCQRLRLMVSGSAALPVGTLQKWREITGHTLLERYGMTEIGMVLSNPLTGERRPGHVGSPLPPVEIRLMTDAGATPADGIPGEIQVRGPCVFREYWRRPDATASAFTADGWFKTGDVAVCENGVYRILGRDSVDIIKSGGYKISALEIEEVLREHPAIAQCAVVGVPDPQWGERVAAAVVLAADGSLDLDALRTWAKERLAPYKVPSLLAVVADLPRNAMGKVTKPEVARGCFSASSPPG